MDSASTLNYQGPKHLVCVTGDIHRGSSWAHQWNVQSWNQMYVGISGPTLSWETPENKIGPGIPQVLQPYLQRRECMTLSMVLGLSKPQFSRVRNRSKMERLYTVNKNKSRSWLWLRSWTHYQIQTEIEESRENHETIQVWPKSNPLWLYSGSEK